MKKRTKLEKIDFQTAEATLLIETARTEGGNLGYPEGRPVSESDDKDMYIQRGSSTVNINLELCNKYLCSSAGNPGDFAVVDARVTKKRSRNNTGHTLNVS